MAWWAWAGCLAVAASRTTNPLLLGLIIAVAAFVVQLRRVPGPWSKAFTVFLVVGLTVIVLRVIMAALFAPTGAGPLLFTLPAANLPDWMAGVRIGGPVTGDSLLFAAYEGLRLTAILACLGAANALVMPSRLLRVVPAALYEIGVAVVIAMTVLPMLVADLGRVRDARRLRGRHTGRLRAAGEMVLPVLNGALDRAVSLAAAMDSRGYGRAAGVSRRTRILTAWLVIVGLLGIGLGLYGALTGGSPGLAGVPVLGWPMVLLGMAMAVGANVLAGRSVGRTVYRPDPWRWSEWAVISAGAVAAASMLAAAATGIDLVGPTSPPAWPSVPLLPALGIAVAALAVPMSPAIPDPTVVSPAAAAPPRSGVAT